MWCRDGICRVFATENSVLEKLLVTQFGSVWSSAGTCPSLLSITGHESREGGRQIETEIQRKYALCVCVQVLELNPHVSSPALAILLSGNHRVYLPTFSNPEQCYKRSFVLASVFDEDSEMGNFTALVPICGKGGLLPLEDPWSGLYLIRWETTIHTCIKMPWVYVSTCYYYDASRWVEVGNNWDCCSSLWHYFYFFAFPLFCSISFHISF